LLKSPTPFFYVFHFLFLSDQALKRPSLITLSPFQLEKKKMSINILFFIFKLKTTVFQLLMFTSSKHANYSFGIVVKR